MSVISNGNGNGHSEAKKPGGVTGKGFKPGQSGNKKGGSKRARAMAAIGAQMRAFLDKPDPEDKRHRSRHVCSMEWLYKNDLKTFYAYAYGRPPEMIEVAAAEGEPIEFVVRLKQEQLP